MEGETLSGECFTGESLLFKPIYIANLIFAKYNKGSIICVYYKIRLYKFVFWVLLYVR